MNTSPAVDLYLNLLKRSLTNTIFESEPDEASASRERFLHGFVKHYVKGPSVSMLPLARMDNVQACIADVLRNNVPGDLIETGVWRGGTTIFMRAALAAYGDETRNVWVADSFEGLPEPDAELYPIEAKAHAGSFMKKGVDFFAAGLDEVKRNFEAYGMLDDRVKFLQGWFKDTLPTAPIEQLSVLRLDGDYYESTMDGLTNLYHKLSVGGYAIIDDYGEDEWTYCRKAVEDFRTKNGIDEPMIKVDSRCYYWQRSR
jgi:Macrocin-O-methyltransferase (TylF)